MPDQFPLTEQMIAATARAMLDLDIPSECLGEVRANLEILAVHARRVAATPDEGAAA